MNFNRKVFREGQKFGKLTAIKYLKTKKYLCICECGNEKIFSTCNLIHGKALSCGCKDSINRSYYNEDMKNKLMNSIKINENGCWEWQKSKHRQGYGNFCYKYKVR